MGTRDAAAEELLQLYEQLQGQAPPDAPPALKELIDDISKSQQAALKKKLEDPDTQDIFPFPGFVVKTVDNFGKKVFINVCSSDKISPPSSWENGIMPDSVRQALHNLDELKSEEDVQAMRVPLSLSDHRSEVDRNGNSCTVFDCVFAEQVMKEAAQFRPMKVFVIECCLGWIQHKCQLQLDPKFKLPKLKYKGDTIHEHRIRKESKKLVTAIEEVVDSDQPSLPLLTKKPTNGTLKAISESKTTSEGRQRPSKPRDSSSSCSAPVSHVQGQGDLQYLNPHVVDVEYEGTPCQKVNVTIKMKAHASQGALNAVVQVDLHCIHVCPEEGTPLAVPLNVYVRSDTCQCSLQGETLKVVLDYMCVDDVIKAAEDQRPLEFGTVVLKSHGLLHDLD